MSKRRYKSEEQILAAIDKNNQAIDSISYSLADVELALKPSISRERLESWQVEELERQRTLLHRSLAIRTGRKRERLADALSTFKTPQLPVVDNGDPSVPA